MPFSAPDSRPFRVLIVEDDPLDAELVIDELRDDGLRFVSERVDDEPAFDQALATFAPDIIVSDVSMPGFSGHRALDRLLVAQPRVPFIFFSGTIGEEAAIEALQRGATDYVLKNNPVRLASSVRRALREAAERQARDRAETELIRAQRFESLGLLAGGLSHDLRNILQPLLITADMIGDHDDPRVRKFGSLVGDCAQRGLEMVASMLSFARGTRGDSQQVRIGPMFEALRMLLQPTVPSRIELSIIKPDPDFAIAGNQTELQQTLLNLCLNAIQAMPERGRLQVAAEAVELDDGFFRSGEVGRSGSYLHVYVKDSGVGMSKDVLDQLFQPFFTTKAEGTGLGLVSCQRIVDNHHGYLRVDSTEDVGTTFSLYLPHGEAATQPNNETLADIPHGNGERLLLVVERAGQLSLMCDALSLHGYAPVAASDGAHALQKIDEYGLPSLLVMDAEMSLMTGVRTLAGLLDRDYCGPVLLMARPDAPPAFDDLPPTLRVRVLNTPLVVTELLRAVHDELNVAPAEKP